MTKILILGGSGMLGHQLFRRLGERMEAWATFRNDSPSAGGPESTSSSRKITQVSVEKPDSVRRAIERVEPDVVVNSIGIVKQRDEAKQAIPSIVVNALFPHQLAAMCDDLGIRLLHISTDCVFSGARGNYAESDRPDPGDLYGRTKLIGEVTLMDSLTIRTSIVGWELSGRSSLLEWFASQRGKVIKGYREAIFSGLSTPVFADLIGDIAETRPDLRGLYHVASKPISKYELLVSLRNSLGWKDIEIEPDDQFHCDRSLNGSRFQAATGWEAPEWHTMIEGLTLDWPRYAEPRRNQSNSP